MFGKKAADLKTLGEALEAAQAALGAEVADNVALTHAIELWKKEEAYWRQTEQRLRETEAESAEHAKHRANLDRVNGELIAESAERTAYANEQHKLREAAETERDALVQDRHEYVVKLDALREEVDGLRHNWHQAVTDGEALVQQVAELQELLRSMKLELALERRAHGETAGTAATQKAAREAAEEKIATMGTEFAALSVAHDSAESEAATLRARVAELETDHDSMSATCDALRAQLQAATLAGAGTSEFARSQPSDASEIINLRSQLEGEREDNAALLAAIDAAIFDMLSGGHPFASGVAKAITNLRAAKGGT